jgi:hypothetical protein
MTLQEIVDLYNNKDSNSWLKVKSQIAEVIQLFEIKIESAHKHQENQTDIRLKFLKKSHIDQLNHSLSLLKIIKHDVNDKDKLSKLAYIKQPNKPINEKPTQGKLF